MLVFQFWTSAFIVCCKVAAYSCWWMQSSISIVYMGPNCIPDHCGIVQSEIMRKQEVESHLKHKIHWTRALVSLAPSSVLIHGGFDDSFLVCIWYRQPLQAKCPPPFILDLWVYQVFLDFRCTWHYLTFYLNYGLAWSGGDRWDCKHKERTTDSRDSSGIHTAAAASYTEQWSWESAAADGQHFRNRTSRASEFRTISLKAFLPVVYSDSGSNEIQGKTRREARWRYSDCGAN